MAAYLARFKGPSRQHSASDLAVFTTWCTDRDLDPLTVQRGHLELYLRWLQETRH
jgi:integrase/recombinase XerD